MSLRLPGLADPAEVRDLSASGVRCVAARAIPLLSLVEVTILLPAGAGAREVVCTGAVVRSARTSDAGAAGDAVWDTAIFFTRVEDADREALDGYVASLRRAGQVA